MLHFILQPVNLQLLPQFTLTLDHQSQLMELLLLNINLLVFGLYEIFAV